MFFSKYGMIVERQLDCKEMNPGDIVVEVAAKKKQENTDVANNTSEPLQQPKAACHKPVTGNMPPPPSKNRFEQQMEFLDAFSSFEEEDHQVKQGKRNNRSSKQKGASVAREQGNSEYHSGAKKNRQKTRRQERSHKQGRTVEMVLDKVEFNVQAQPFESRTLYG